MSVFILVAVLVAVACAACVAFASRRHKRGAHGDVNLIGLTGTIERELRPEGAVLVEGEVWPARSPSGRTLTRADAPRVLVVGVGSHWVEVEPLLEDEPVE